MQKKDGSKKIKENIFYYIILFIIVILVAFSLYIWMSRPLKVQTLDVSFTVGDTIGVDLNSSLVSFGRVLREGSAVRNVIVKNEYDYPVKIDIFVSKDISEYVSVSSYFVILPGEEIRIPINLKIPEDMEFGEYSGKIKFEFIKSE